MRSSSEFWLRSTRLVPEKTSARRVDFVSVDPLYNMQKDQNANISEYDILILENMGYMGKILADVMKPEAHVHVMCSSL